MSLLDEYARPCVLMDKQRVQNDEGGFETVWVEGAPFMNYQARDSSMEARVAEKQGVTSVYSVLVDKAVPIEYGDYFKDKESGVFYRVTSRPDETQAPKSASFHLKFFTAERADLTT